MEFLMARGEHMAMGFDSLGTPKFREQLKFHAESRFSRSDLPIFLHYFPVSGVDNWVDPCWRKTKAGHAMVIPLLRLCKKPL